MPHLVTPIAPSRTHEQKLAALKEANRIRCYRASVKLDLREGRRYFPALRDDPDMATAKVSHFLLALPKIGSCKAAEVLRRTGISPSKTFAGCTDRQWNDLIAFLRKTHAGQHHELHVALTTERTAA